MAFPPESTPVCAETVTLERAAPAPLQDISAKVEALLRQSRAAHDRKKQAAGLTDKDGKVTRRPNYPQAEAEMCEALRLRQEAHALDPEHTSPAWAADQIANKGLTHEQMCEWFSQYALIP